MSDYISKAQAVAQTIAEIEALDIIEVCKALEQKIKNDYISQPSADVAEVVRCKDCEWWTKQEDSLQGRCALMQSYPTGAWYCADGERKEK